MADELVDRGQFAAKTTIIGGCLGSGVALSLGGSLAQQATVALLLTAVVSAGLYRILLELAARVTDGSDQSRTQTQNGGAKSGSESHVQIDDPVTASNR
ncbi:hypothetical protein ACLI4Z_05395 [Natrialbaceae archaeon A-arb3/5]